MGSEMCIRDRLTTTHSFITASGHRPTRCDAYYTFRQRREVAIALICGLANLRISKLMRPNVGGNFTSAEFLGQIVHCLTCCYWRATVRHRLMAGVFLQLDRAMESTSRQPVVDCFATILTAAQKFLATIWPLSKFFDFLCTICESPQQRLSHVNSLRLALRRRCSLCQITLTSCF